MAIRHKYASTVANDTDANTVGPLEWNDEHNHPPFVIPVSHDASGVQSATNLGAGPTEITPLSRTRNVGDLTHATEVRVIVGQSAAASAGSWGSVQYATDFATPAWAELGDPNGPRAPLSTTAQAICVSPWVPLVALAKADVLLRAIFGGGDGVADPSFYYTDLQIR